MKNNTSVSVVLPCFNEKGNIVALIDSIQLQLQDFDFEIIVVDDNSPDGTYAYLLSQNLDRVKVIKRSDEPSLALSIEAGLKASQGDYLVVMDSDFNHRPRDIKILLSNLRFFDCVMASRFVYGGRMDTRFRHVCSWVFNVFTRIVTRTYITDSLFGFFAIKREVLFGLPFDKVFWGYGDYCIRLMYFLQKKQHTILQIPGILGKRMAGQGNTRLITTLLQYTFEVIKFSISNKE